MVKMHLPFPTQDQRRFELVEWSRDRGPASLNYQFVYVLLHLGVPIDTFLTFLREYAGLLRNDLVSRPTHFILDDILDSSASVGSFAGRALAMISAGFKPNNAPHLKRLLLVAAAAKMGRLAERLRVPVLNSRWLMIVADPTGCLEFGQAYAHPSSLNNPLKGRAIVSRNPCHLPSDVQVVECVNIPRLAHIRDALVLPIKGPYPAAQLLSGGDYDGDLAFISWDTRLLPPAGCLERMPPPELPQSPLGPIVSEFSNPVGLKTIKEISKTTEERHSNISSAMIELFKGFTPTLGVLTQIHAAIAEKEGVGSANAKRAGWLCREAVDSAKSSGVKIRVPKSLQSVAGLLSKEEVLNPIREECKRLKQAFEAEEAKENIDQDLILDFSEDEAIIAQSEFSDWRVVVRKALSGNEMGIESVKSEFRKRFVAFGKKERRLHLASAYYFFGGDSSNDSFAFNVCFRELLRIKADAVQSRNEKDDCISLSIPYESWLAQFEQQERDKENLK